MSKTVVQRRPKRESGASVVTRLTAGEPRTFQSALLNLADWFEKQKRVLPWRDSPTLYRVWVSEIMLQQTQVITVVPYFERFMTRFPTVQSLARADEGDVLHAWAGLGYYSRARNLHAAAKKVVEDWGDFPRTREGWLEMPGVGPYTAGAILSIALNQPEAILDGNVERVMSRIRRVNRRSGDAPYKERLWRLSRIWVQRAFGLGIPPSVLNQALMELGAILCTPKKPKCLLCPVADVCRAKQVGEQEAYPPRKAPKQWVRVQEELHCVTDGQGRILLQRRASGEWRAGLWDLPAEKPDALGAVGAPNSKAKLIRIGKVTTQHVVTRHKVTRTTHVWLITGKAVKPALWKASDSVASSGGAWISMKDPEVAIGSALKRTWQAVLETFPEASPRS